jgi:hypothetical protein
MKAPGRLEISSATEDRPRCSLSFRIMPPDNHPGASGHRSAPGLRSATLGVPVGLTAKIRNVALRLLQCVYFGVCVMNDVVEGILHIYQSMRPLDAERVADSRQRISRYIENLASAGQRDDEQLTIYGLAYLTELIEGADPRFTGC